MLVLLILAQIISTLVAKGYFSDKNVSGAASAFLKLAVDLTGKSDFFLDFWARSTGGGSYRRVFISDDNGTNWKMISELSGASSTFSNHMPDNANAAEVNGRKPE